MGQKTNQVAKDQNKAVCVNVAVVKQLSVASNSLVAEAQSPVALGLLG
jgi:hypothetical protein